MFLALSSIVLSNMLIAYALPEQFILNYGKSSSEMVVSWADFNSDNQTVTCQYGSTANNLDKTADVSAKQYTIKTYTSPTLYKATLTGLTEGNQVYYYRVGSANGYSEVKSFKSHPGVGVSDVTFHFIGDLGQTANSNNTLSDLLDNEHALLTTLSGGIVSMGDLSYANGNQPLWDSFGNLVQYATSEVPMMTTSGNHEWLDESSHYFTAYLSRYDNPPITDGTRELYYSYNAGLAHFVMLAGYCSSMKSVYSQPCLSEGSPEREWLIKDLNSVDSTVTPWVFVIFHQPYVNSNTAHSMATEGAPMQAEVEDILYASGVVDAVFSGHVHAYERSCRVYKYTCTPDAPYYITIGDGGNAEGLATGWVSPQPAWSAFRQASYGHGELLVLNETHTLWQWHQNKDLAPVVSDELWIVKGDVMETNRPGVTATPVFADTERGRLGALYEKNLQKLKSEATTDNAESQNLAQFGLRGSQSLKWQQ